MVVIRRGTIVKRDETISFEHYQATHQPSNSAHEAAERGTTSESLEHL